MKHILIQNNKISCVNCGENYNLEMPISIQTLLDKIDDFKAIHKDCKYVERTELDRPISLEARLDFWGNHGKIGLSSRTMFNCLSNRIVHNPYHPYDPSDFGRCYELLKLIPEWKLELDKLKCLSNEWKVLVENWDTLTSMYEENIATDWKKSKEIGMYEFMIKILDI